jgi:tetratricopeptide (TPR) repeat protein
MRENIKVKATYSVVWQFRHHPEIETSYFRYEEKSMSDWDYAIVTNRYISPYKLKKKIWPPEDALHIIYADDVPVCAVIKRKTKDDYSGYVALNEGRNDEAVKYFENAVKIDDRDEMIFYNFAAALYNTGKYQRADSVLKKGLEINPDFELILMYLGNIARSKNKTEEAIAYYEKVINADRKYFEAYVSAAELLIEKDVEKSRILLRECLEMNPKFKPAIIAMADTYRKTNPDIAEKYDELAGRME